VNNDLYAIFTNAINQSHALGINDNQCD